MSDFERSQQPQENPDKKPDDILEAEGGKPEVAGGEGGGTDTENVEAVETTPDPERRAELKKAAMEEYKGFEKDVVKTTVADGNLAEETKAEGYRLARVAENASPRDISYRQANDLASETAQFIRNKPRVFEKSRDLQSVVQAGGGNIESILDDLSKEEDPKRALEKAEEVIKLFDHILTSVQEERDESKRERRVVRSHLEERAQKAKLISIKGEVQLDLDLRDSAIEQFHRDATRLSGNLEDAERKISAYDREVTDSGRLRRIRFEKLVSELARR